MGTKALRHAAYRQAVIDGAEVVFGECGYHGAKMSEVAQRAGIALGTLYSLFGGKEAIFAAIHESRGKALLEQAARNTQAARSARDALRLGVQSYVEFLLEHPNYLRIHLRESQPWALEPQFTTEVQREQWRQGLALTVAVFKAGIAEGSIIDDDPQRMARLMIATHQVHLADWVERGGVEPAAELAQRMVAHVERAFLSDLEDAAPVCEADPPARVRPPS